MPATRTATASDLPEDRDGPVVPLLTADAVADRLGYHRSSVYGLALPRVRLGRGTVRWRPCDLGEVDATVQETERESEDLEERWLLDAETVGTLLSVPTKRVYKLPIARAEIGENTVRWRPEDVRGFIEERLVRA